MHYYSKRMAKKANNYKNVQMLATEKNSKKCPKTYCIIRIDYFENYLVYYVYFKKKESHDRDLF